MKALPSAIGQHPPAQGARAQGQDYLPNGRFVAPAGVEQADVGGVAGRRVAGVYGSIEAAGASARPGRCLGLHASAEAFYAYENCSTTGGAMQIWAW